MATQDSNQNQLFEKRKYVFPKAVDGFFRRTKWAIMALALAIYYITPWIRWERGEFAPDQAVLVDLANRRFYFFMIEIWPHEFYYVAGLLIMAGIGLFMVTSVVGRAWCGYACPQTVWTDVFQHVERWIDGDRNAQIRLVKAPWNARKISRRLLKWAIWLLIAVMTGGAWIFYFADAPQLAQDLWTGNAPIVAWGTIFVLTMTTFIFGGFLREQVCIYMCPWPRIQTTMMDEKSLLVTYKNWRGEPRGSLKKSEKNPGVFGDCVDCNQCVAVCPTGVDIREGAQIGCITCGLCIDACDKVMRQTGRERGLIDYVTLNDTECEKKGENPVGLIKTLLRPRTMVYFAFWLAIGLAMALTFGNRSRLDLSLQHDRNPLFVQLSDGDVRNGYTASIRNMEGQSRTVILKLSGLENGVIWTDLGDEEDAAREVSVTLAPDGITKVRLFIAAPGEGGRAEFNLLAVDSESGETITQDGGYFERP